MNRAERRAQRRDPKAKTLGLGKLSSDLANLRKGCAELESVSNHNLAQVVQALDAVERRAIAIQVYLEKQSENSIDWKPCFEEAINRQLAYAQKMKALGNSPPTQVVVEVTNESDIEFGGDYAKTQP